MKLSVIIPVYNAEAYLEKCVESVASFPMEKEIILVNDGSTDHSSEICDRFQVSGSKFQVPGSRFQVPEVKVIHQENRGVSAARNAGLDVATGDYVWFVDADDTVLMPSDLNLASLDKEHPSMVVFGFVWDEDGMAKSFGASKDEVPYNLWRCWFDRKTIEEKKIRFTEGRKYAEDQEFILGFMVSGFKFQVSSFRFQVSGSRFQVSGSRFQVSAINEPLYYYTLRPGSAMTRKGVKCKKIADVAAVLFGFAWRALMSGAIAQGWVWREIRRMTKSLYITIKR